MIQSQGRQADWRRANPVAYEGHKAVNAALRRGDLVKGSCQICGATSDDTRIDAHHEDYSKPLEVTWLCRSHHIRLHRQPPSNSLPANTSLQAVNKPQRVLS